MPTSTARTPRMPSLKATTECHHCIPPRHLCIPSPHLRLSYRHIMHLVVSTQEMHFVNECVKNAHSASSHPVLCHRVHLTTLNWSLCISFHHNCAPAPSTLIRLLPIFISASIRWVGFRSDQIGSHLISANHLVSRISTGCMRSCRGPQGEHYRQGALVTCTF